MKYFWSRTRHLKILVRLFWRYSRGRTIFQGPPKQAIQAIKKNYMCKFDSPGLQNGLENQLYSLFELPMSSKLANAGVHPGSLKRLRGASSTSILRELRLPLSVSIASHGPLTKTNIYRMYILSIQVQSSLLSSHFMLASDQARRDIDW